MKQIRLGKTELQVSEIGFGGIPIIPLPMDEAVNLVQHCYDLGITFYDTANMYFTSEEKIGKALASVRDKVVIATKTTERGKEEATAHIDLSLRQLDTDCIDIYQLHNISNQETLDQVLAPGGAMEAVLKARESGKIRHIGVSSHSIRTAMVALETDLFETIQFPFNFIENDPLDELFPLAGKKDIGIIGMKPLGGGMLERADLCFRYLQQHPDIVPIPGFKTTAEVDEVVGFYQNRKSISSGDREDMQGTRSTLGEEFCHRCEYCMPCEQGVQIPSVLIYRAVAKR
ncbi:MAG: aldo/keto reductase, partial [Deltaproteobacteria bacterium]|nr:aldo/keto reductase [Deltaproteobacteria bacterium]